MKTALLIVDVQKAMDHPKWGERSTPGAEENMARLLTYWRQNSWPVFHVQDCSPDPNSPYHPGQPLHDFKDEVNPVEGETIIQKTTGNSFIGTELEKMLHEAGVTSVVIVGVHTQHCVDSAMRTADNLGFNVTLVSDATVATAVEDTSGKHWSAEEVQTYTISLLSSHMTACTTAEIIESG